MLVEASLCLDKIIEQRTKSIRNEKFKYYHQADYVEVPETPNSDWNVLSYASVNHEGEVVGHITCRIARPERHIYGLGAINFSDSNIFPRDLLHFFDLIFIQRKFRKVNFEILIGNPAERLYDRFIEKYGGRIVGIKEENVMLLDGELYDEKLYELKRESYIVARNKSMS